MAQTISQAEYVKHGAMYVNKQTYAIAATLQRISRDGVAAVAEFGNVAAGEVKLGTWYIAWATRPYEQLRDELSNYGIMDIGGESLWADDLDIYALDDVLFYIQQDYATGHK